MNTTKIHLSKTILTAIGLLAAGSISFAQSSANPTGAEQSTEQSGAQPAMTIEQKADQYVTWVLSSYNPKSTELDNYRLSCAKWVRTYNDVAVPAIKKYGTAQEKETMGVISKDGRKVEHEIDASGVRVIKFNTIMREARIKMQQKPSEKAYAYTLQKAKEAIVVFNKEAEFTLEKIKILQQYHQTTTDALKRIIGELKKDPKTQSAAATIEKGWTQSPRFIRYTKPLKVALPAEIAE